MHDDLSPQIALAAAVVLLMVLAGIAGALRRFGIFSERAFAHAPHRIGRLGLPDLMMVFGLALLTQALAVHAVTLPPAEDQSGRAMLFRMLFTQITALPAILYILLRARAVVRGGLAGFGFDPRRFPAAVKFGVGTMAVVFPVQFLLSAAIVNLMRAVGRHAPQIAHDALVSIRDEPWDAAKIGLIVSAVVLAPIVEELLFRGLLQTALQQSGLVRRRWVAIVITSLLFAAIHYDIAQLYVLPVLFVLALGLGYAYERSGSLLSPMLVHAAFNAMQIALALSLPDRKEQAVACLSRLF